MEIRLRTGFAAVKHSIPFNPQTKVKGEALAVSHVCRVEEISPSGTSPGRISASVIRQTSVTLPPYKVHLEIDAIRNIFATECTCVSAAGHKCKHTYALIHYVNSDRSATKTSLEQEWGKPSDSQLGKAIYAKPLVIADCFKTKYQLRQINVAPYNIQLSDFAEPTSPLYAIVKEESRTIAERIVRLILTHNISEAVNISTVRSCEACVSNLLIFAEESELYLQDANIVDQDLKDFYEKNVQLTELQITELCIRTEEQHTCSEWVSARKCRITASSKAHLIKIRTKKDITNLLSSFLKDSQGVSSQAMEYGKNNERAAIAEYAKEFKVRVFHIGLLVLHVQPWLSASPDGIVVEDECITKLVEVKCPFSCKSVAVFDALTGKFNVPYVEIVNNKVELKSGHMYYTQCQVQLYVTGLSECDLFIWSPKGSYRVTVLRDDVFLKNLIVKLHDFYFQFYLPALVDAAKENVAPN